MTVSTFGMPNETCLSSIMQVWLGPKPENQTQLIYQKYTIEHLTEYCTKY